MQWLNWMFYNTNIIQSNFPEITLHRSQETDHVNYQQLILDNEAFNDEFAIKGVTHDLHLVPTEHEAGEKEDSDEESIKSVETGVSSSSKNHPKTISG